MNYRDPQRRSALAAEYVLGNLRGPARRRFERLLTADFELQREVERWQDDLYPPLIEVLPQTQPPAQVWAAIAAQTRPPPQKPARAQKVSLWDNLVFWRSWGAFATAAVLVLALYLGLILPRQDLVVTPDYVAVVNDSAAQAAWLVQIDRAERRLQVQALRTQPLEADRSFELWLLPGAAQPPRSLGLIPARGRAQLALVPELLELLPGAAGLAVSVEPAGGSPSGQPSGPVLYQGVLAPPA